MSTLRQKYIGWLDKAMDYQEEEWITIDAAFAQIAHEEERKEEELALSVRKRNVEIMAASACETLWRHYRILGDKFNLKKELEGIRKCFLAITKGRFCRGEIFDALEDGEKYFELRTVYS